MHSAVSLCWAAYTAADGNVQVSLWAAGCRGVWKLADHLAFWRYARPCHWQMVGKWPALVGHLMPNPGTWLEAFIKAWPHNLACAPWIHHADWLDQLSTARWFFLSISLTYNSTKALLIHASLVNNWSQVHTAWVATALHVKCKLHVPCMWIVRKLQCMTSQRWSL